MMFRSILILTALMAAACTSETAGDEESEPVVEAQTTSRPPPPAITVEPAKIAPSSGAHTNPAYQENGNQGEMP